MGKPGLEWRCGIGEEKDSQESQLQGENWAPFAGKSFEKGEESNRNAGEERTAVRAWRGAMKGSKAVLELAKQSWYSDRFL